jgi:hypothetical protein
MATAKQLAARAKFAAMAKSGALKKLRAAKKPARKTNPAPLALLMGRASSAKDVYDLVPKKNPALMSHEQRQVDEFKTLSTANQVKVLAAVMRDPKASGPLIRALRAAVKSPTRRATNPLPRVAGKPPARYVVYVTNKDKDPTRELGDFLQKADAVAFARWYAEKHGVSLIIHGKGL